MNPTSPGIVASESGVANSDEPRPDNLLAASWIVLEAANDLGDHATVEACRRVIDSNLSGKPVSQSDVHIVLDYFR
jgi:hypothetical protein